MNYKGWIKWKFFYLVMKMPFANLKKKWLDWANQQIEDGLTIIETDVEVLDGP